MKVFTVPLINKELKLYVGKRDWQRFQDDLIAAGMNPDSCEKYPGKQEGRAAGSYIWVDSLADRDILIHELVHFIDDTMDFIGSSDREFRAYVGSWAIHEVFKWRSSKGDKDESV